MEPASTRLLRIGTWCLNPISGQISREGESVRLEARTLRLLVCLADHAGQVVTFDDLLNHVWPGVTVSQDSVYQAVASLRKLLGDDPKQPEYIATVPRLGYRMVATVSPWQEQAAAPPLPLAASEPGPAPAAPEHTQKQESRRNKALWAIIPIACLALVLVAYLALRSGIGGAGHTQPPVVAAHQTQRSVAVLPFLDLTQGMRQGEFADGMTEELIDKLSKLPGMHVPSPTSSFYYRDKEMPVADIAKALGVAYILDGSVRKSGDRVRVATRLIRADNGFVVWTETYDRPFHDLLMVQDDIASEVTRALGASTELNTR